MIFFLYTYTIKSTNSMNYLNVFKISFVIERYRLSDRVSGRCNDNHRLNWIEQFNIIDIIRSESILHVFIRSMEYVNSIKAHVSSLWLPHLKPIFFFQWMNSNENDNNFRTKCYAVSWNLVVFVYVLFGYVLNNTNFGVDMMQMIGNDKNVNLILLNVARFVLVCYGFWKWFFIDTLTYCNYSLTSYQYFHVFVISVQRNEN